MNFKFPLSNNTWDNNEYRAIKDVVNSGMLTMGENVDKFEEKFSSYIGAKYSIAVNSGSSANLLMIAALFYYSKCQVQYGDEIIVPAVSWGTTYFPLVQYGLKLRIVDIDINTLNYDLDALERAITNNTKAIMVVNLLGNPNDFDKIYNLINDRDILVIEDNCESMGAVYNAKKTGTFGIMGSFSTFFSHHISTIEGGIVVTDNEELWHILLSLRAHGWTRNLPKSTMIHKSHSNDFYESYKFILPGYNLRPNEIQGALGVEQLNKIDMFIKNRRLNADIFISAFQDSPDFFVQQEIGTSSWFGFSLIVRDKTTLTRDKLIKHLKKLGFEIRPILAGNIARHDVIKHMNVEVPFSLENANFLHDNGLYIGNTPLPIGDAVDLLIEELL